MEAPILQCSEMYDGNVTVVFNVNSAFILICAIEEPYVGKCFSDSPGTMKVLIFQCVMDVFGVVSEEGTATNEAGNEMGAIDAFFSRSLMMHKRFKQKSNEALTSRKKSAKKLFFQFLGYISLFASTTKTVALNLRIRMREN